MHANLVPDRSGESGRIEDFPYSERLFDIEWAIVNRFVAHENDFVICARSGHRVSAHKKGKRALPVLRMKP